MKTLKLTTLALAATLSFSSCSDFLTEVNPNAITTDTFWRNLEDTNKGLIGAYNAFRSPNIYQINSDNNRSDLTYPGYGRPSTTNSYWLHTYTDASQDINSKWSALYTGIFRANQVIEALQRIKGDQVEEDDVLEWESQMAQARFLRGVFHFWLNVTYNQGSVIKYDFVPRELADFKQKLTSSDDVKAFYRTDIEYAHEHLPLEWDGNNLGRVTKGSAAAILGQSYLYDKDYDTAKTYFKEIIDSGVYELVDVSMNSTTKGEFNKESILEVSYTIDFNTEFGNWAPEALHNNHNMSVSTVGGWRTILPSLWLAVAFKEDALDLKDERNQVLDETTGDVTGFHPYSLRASYSVALVDDTNIPYYGYAAANAGFNNKEYAYFRKHSNWDICENEKDLKEISGVNYRLIRLADIYLMYAECLIEAGNKDAGVDEALVYINRVRKRSALQLLGLGDEEGAEYTTTAVTFNSIDYTAQTLMDHLMYIERPLELCLEGYSLRQIDLRRWGVTKQRFQELSQTYFSLEDGMDADGWFLSYDYIDKNGKPAKKWNCRPKHYDPAIHTDKSLVFSDFNQAAGNYNDQQHAYYPIPNGETMANDNL